MSLDEVRTVAERLVDASERGDLAAMGALFDPEASIWRSDLGVLDRERFLRTVERLRDHVGSWRYGQRRLHLAPDAFVEQHVVGFERAEVPDALACLIAEVRDGLIVRLDEYVSIDGLPSWTRSE